MVKSVDYEDIKDKINLEIRLKGKRNGKDDCLTVGCGLCFESLDKLSGKEIENLGKALSALKNNIVSMVNGGVE